jgi:hypothetical protein
MNVFNRRRRWHIPRGILEVFVFSQMRTQLFPLSVLELWDLSRRRWCKLLVAQELLVSSRRRRLLVALELLVSSRRRQRTLLDALELWSFRLFHWRSWPSLRALLELWVLRVLSERSH